MSIKRSLLSIGLIGLLSPALVSLSLSAQRPVLDDEALKAANSRPGEWMTHGRTQDEQRYSPLEKISDLNVQRLRLAWTFDTGTDRVLEATPLVVDGVMYTTASWGIVFALDAKTGKPLWKWDPKVDPRYERFACCDVVNRGVAFYKGRVYAAAFDGRLTALDAKTGEVVWSVVTVDQTKASNLVDQRPHQIDAEAGIVALQRIERRGVVLDPRRQARAVGPMPWRVQNCSRCSASRDISTRSLVSSKLSSPWACVIRRRKP